MGAEIVVAVSLGTPLLKREALGSVLGVMAQMMNILTEQNVRASLASPRPTDILGVDTPLGPLYVPYVRTHEGLYSFYLFLGRP